MVSSTNSFRNIGPMSHSQGGTGQFKMAPGYLVWHYSASKYINLRPTSRAPTSTMLDGLLCDKKKSWGIWRFVFFPKPEKQGAKAINWDELENHFKQILTESCSLCAGFPILEVPLSRLLREIYCTATAAFAQLRTLQNSLSAAIPERKVT